MLVVEYATGGDARGSWLARSSLCSTARPVSCVHGYCSSSSYKSREKELKFFSKRADDSRISPSVSLQTRRLEVVMYKKGL